MKGLLHTKIMSWIKILIPIVLLVLIFVEVQKFATDFDIGLLKKHILDLSFFHVLLMIVIGLIGVLPMMFYDYFFTRNRHIQLTWIPLFKISFISNTFSNFIGFGGFSGAALRSYFYRKNHENRSELIKEIAKLSLYYLTGLSVLSWLLVARVLNPSLLLTYKWLNLAVWGIALYVPILLVIGFRNNKLRDWKYSFTLILVSTIEWIFAFLTIFSIARIINVPISFSSLLAIFIIAAAAGVISMIPGGLGSFDFIVLSGLGLHHIPQEQGLLLLVLYRFCYFIFPFFIGTIFLFQQAWDSFNRKLNSIPEIIIRNLSHYVLTALVLISGIVLLISASLPGIFERLTFMKGILSIPIMNISNQLSVAAGISLLGLARGIEYKVKRAFYLTFIVLLAGSVFTFSKGFDYEEAFFVLIVAWMLWMSRGRFYRENFVHTWGRMLFDIIAILLFVGLYIFVGYVNIPTSHVKIPAPLRSLVMADPTDLLQSGLIGFIIATCFLTIGFFILRPKKFPYISTRDQETKISEHLNRYGGTVLSHLLFLHDKYIYWSKDEKVLFSFQQYADKLIILGNPVGEKDDIFKAIEEFRDEADIYGLTPIYYQVSKEMLPYLHENGYGFFKLGEEAYTNLADFSLSGKKMKNLRAIKNKFVHEHIHFEVIAPPFSMEFMDELKAISDEWLGERKEKGFSLGFFDEDYIRLTPVATLRDSSGKMIAFATIMPVYDHHQVISIDLMRYNPDAPSGTMDNIFLNIIEWAKEQNYGKFNLGMAPLSNVGISKYSFLSEKIASQIFLYGHAIYHFKGLRNFKNKYATEWEPKYLAYRRKSSLPFTMAQVAFVIARTRKQIK